LTALASQLGGMRRSEFRRLLMVSALVHVGGFLLFAISPSPTSSPAGLPAVIPVELVELRSAPAAAPQARVAPAPKPVAKAEPAPVPKPVPPPPVQKKVVLPAEPAPPKPKPEPKPEPRRELDPAEVAPPAPPQAQDYDDVLAELRAEVGEEAAAPQPTAVPQAAPAPTAGAGGSGPVSPAVAAWITRVKIHVRRHWVVPPGFRTQPLQTALTVRLAADGTVLGEPAIQRRSGNPWYDEGVLRAIQKSSPLPAPPEAGEWPFVFAPEDSY